MLNHLFRYVPVARLVRQLRPDRILEVGSGWQGMGPYVARSYVGCDPCLSPQGRPRSDTRPMAPVAGSACDLPFRDDSFDLVVCLDVLEHIPAPLRPQAVGELRRVSGGVLVLGFPRGHRWARWEERTAAWYRWTGRSTPDWLAEHFALGLPSERLLPDLLNATGARYRNQGNANNLVHFITNLLEASRLRSPITRLSRAVGYHPTYLRASGSRQYPLAAVLRHLQAVCPLTDLGQTVRRLYIIYKDQPLQPAGDDNVGCREARAPDLNPGQVDA